LAIVQISQITNRKGLAADLPQLAGAELGWSTDTRQLWIGNGTLVDGAPVIGNTEILTEFSDIFNLAAQYTYEGTAAGYIVQTGPTAGTPVTTTLQNWMDQWASVKDFGAKGDGVTDDTFAINRALNQLYCQQVNPQIRRTLFFPAGVYVTSGSILIPPYATLYGEGPNNSIIRKTASGSTGTVAQTADSLQQYGNNIGLNGATPPTDITISNMAFQSLDTNKIVFLVQSANNCTFRGVSFIGAGTTSNLNTITGYAAGVSFGSTTSLVTTDILLDGCRFTNTVWGAFAIDQTKGITITNSYFNTLYQGVAIGLGSSATGTPTGTRITNNVFDNIYNSGIVFGQYSTLGASGYNIFYDVANSFLGTTNPTTYVIQIASNNNVSIGDMFQRTDAYSTNYARVNINNTQSIATTNGVQLALGSLVVQSGLAATLVDNSLLPLFTFNIGSTGAVNFKVDYSITRNSVNRTGTLWVTSQGIGAINYMEDYTESGNVGVALTVTQVGNTITVTYSTIPSTGSNGQMYYSIRYLN